MLVVINSTVLELSSVGITLMKMYGFSLIASYLSIRTGLDAEVVEQMH